MNELPSNDFAKKSKSSRLEKLTALVLFLVVLSLVWMVTVAFQPEWLRILSLDLEVVLVVGVLILALVLVSLVALLQTRS